MNPRKHMGNLSMPAEHTDHDCYIVGYCNAILEIEEKNRFVAIRSVKYSTHKKSDVPRKDAKPDDETRVTILLAGGPWRQSMWLSADKSDEEKVELYDAGDYLIWEPGFYHSWQPLGDSTMLTVSLWRPKLEIKPKCEG